MQIAIRFSFVRDVTLKTNLSCIHNHVAFWSDCFCPVWFNVIVEFQLNIDYKVVFFFDVEGYDE